MPHFFIYFQRYISITYTHIRVFDQSHHSNTSTTNSSRADNGATIAKSFRRNDDKFRIKTHPSLHPVIWKGFFGEKTALFATKQITRARHARRLFHFAIVQRRWPSFLTIAEKWNGLCKKRGFLVNLGKKWVEKGCEWGENDGREWAVCMLHSAHCVHCSMTFKSQSVFG